MIQNASAFVDEFLSHRNRGIELHIRHEALRAPHEIPRDLPAGCAAVYVSSLSEAYGGTVPAGPNRVLKIGMAGRGSARRFTTDHYGGNAGSTLFWSILYAPERWRSLGIPESLQDDEIRPWLLANTDRDHFFVPARFHPEVVRQLEVFLIANLNPIFEGGTAIDEGRGARTPRPGPGERPVSMAWEMYDAVRAHLTDVPITEARNALLRRTDAAGGRQKHGYRHYTVAEADGSAQLLRQMLSDALRGLNPILESSTKHGRTPRAGRKVLREICQAFGWAA